MCKKLTAVLMALILAMGCVSALAENTKHERVFVVAGADGTVQSLTDSIRLENADKAEEIRDRTMLTGILNAGGDEAFTLEGEALIWAANGKDIVYQGTSDKALPVVPTVSLALDGETVTAEELAGRSGHAELAVTFTHVESVPYLAAVVMLLPETGIANLQAENALVMSLSGHSAVVGWAVPGADESLKLPDTIRLSFDADHAELGWLMAFASADPIDAVCGEIDSRLSGELTKDIREVKEVLTALRDGQALPEAQGKAGMVTGKINELNAGLKTLDDSAKQRAEGAGQLNAGLETLSENSAALNDGADAVFAGILDAANKQLAASDLSATGLAVPVLTAENYEKELTGLIALLQPFALLKPEVKTAVESLQALKEQLGQVKTFVDGVKAYTGGVDQASGGAKQLAEGAAALQSQGTGALQSSILGTEKLGAVTGLAFMDNQMSRAMRIYEATRDQAKNGGYDLRPEGMKTVTVYIIRTDLK